MCVCVCVCVYTHTHGIPFTSGTRLLAHHTPPTRPRPRVEVPDARVAPRAPRRRARRIHRRRRRRRPRAQPADPPLLGPQLHGLTRLRAPRRYYYNRNCAFLLMNQLYRRRRPRVQPYTLNTYSRIPEAQPQENEYCIPPVEPCTMIWIRTYSRSAYLQSRRNVNRIPHSFPPSAYSTHRRMTRHESRYGTFQQGSVTTSGALTESSRKVPYRFS